MSFNSIQDNDNHLSDIASESDQLSTLCVLHATDVTSDTILSPQELQMRIDEDSKLLVSSVSETKTKEQELKFSDKKAIEKTCIPMGSITISPTTVLSETQHKKRFKFGSKRKEQDIEKSDVEQELLKPSTLASMVSETQTEKRRFRFGKRKEEKVLLSYPSMTLSLEQQDKESSVSTIRVNGKPVIDRQYTREMNIVHLTPLLSDDNVMASLYYDVLVNQHAMKKLQNRLWHGLKERESYFKGECKHVQHTTYMLYTFMFLVSIALILFLVKVV